MSEWKEFFLNDVYTISSGLSKPAEDFGSGFPFLSFKEVFNNFFVPKNLSELVESSEKERLTCSIKRGDVFLTRTSETVNELGMSCVALKDHENATFNGFTKRLRPKGNIEIVPEYAGYYFRNTKFRKEITSMSSASTRASLNIEMIGRLKIVLPSKAEQSSIGFTLKTLDDKIDNLRRQNETLEAIAQTLFKHWFIDFEFPNADGKPYKSSGGAMVRSELGEIPEGWHVGKLGELVSELISGDWGKEQALGEYKNEVICLRGTDLSTLKSGIPQKAPIRFIHNKKIEPCKLKNGDLIIEISGGSPEQSTGRIIYINSQTIGNFDLPLICSNFCKVIRPTEREFQYFIYCLNNYLYFRRVFFNLENGTTTIQNLDIKSYLYGYEIVMPSKLMLIKFDTVTNDIFIKIQKNIKQIQTLTKTRDALLPKLMSGQLRVKE